MTAFLDLHHLVSATLGRLDGSVTRDELFAHCRQLVAAVDIPVAADGENGDADDPAGVAETVRLASDTGLDGFSVEDFTGRRDDPIYELGLARERIAAAAEAAGDLVLTARCENFLHGRRDLGDTITRLQAYQEAGADVLFAPGVVQVDELRTLVSSVDRPVNVLAVPGCPPVDELASMGVASWDNPGGVRRLRGLTWGIAAGTATSSTTALAGTTSRSATATSSSAHRRSAARRGRRCCARS